MIKSVYTDYIESKGYTTQECNRPANITDETVYAAGYSSRDEYLEALHDWLNGQ